MTNLLMIVLLAAAAAEETPAPKGRICIAERKATLSAGQCTNTTGTNIAVTPADRTRLFVWTSDDQSTLHLGTIEPKAAQVDLDPAPHSTVNLSLAGAESRGWPAGVTLTFRGKEQWVWPLDAKGTTRLRRIIVPRGNAGMMLAADRHRTLRRAQVNATTDTVTLGELRLVPLPVARGTVVNAEGKAVGGAIISRPDGTVCTDTNEQGAFVCELAEPMPEALVVSASGFGGRELSIERGRETDVDFGRVMLSTGHVLKLRIVRPEPGPAKVTLFVDAPERYDHSKLKTVSIREREEEVRFDAGAGTYLALIEGEGPLERLEVPVEMKDEDLTQEITIAPYRLTGTFQFGEEPLRAGRVEVIAPQHTWRVHVPVADGAFAGTLWQHGKLRAFVAGPELGISELVESPELGDDPSRWDIRIAKRMIAGRILDAETRAPIPDADMDLTIRYERGNANMSVKVKPDARYEILANRVGTYNLRVTSKEHIPYSTDIVVAAEDASRTMDVLLERGVLQPLDIVTAAGAPVPNARVLEGVRPDRVNPQFINQADARGRYDVRGRPGETRVLYVVPQEGSLAVVRLQIPRSGNDVRPLQVVVPPTASLRVRTVDGEGKPAPAALLIRYNGEFIPLAMARFITGDMPGTAPSGEGVLARMPVGAYELWALKDRQDEEAVIHSGGALREPARVGLSGGEQAVTVVKPAP